MTSMQGCTHSWSSSGLRTCTVTWVAPGHASIAAIWLALACSVFAAVNLIALRVALKGLVPCDSFAGAEFRGGRLSVRQRRAVAESGAGNAASRSSTKPLETSVTSLSAFSHPDSILCGRRGGEPGDAGEIHGDASCEVP